MTEQQMKWAKLHDWFWSWANNADTGHAYVVTVAETGTKLVDGKSTPYREYHDFSDYKALRDWAGY